MINLDHEAAQHAQSIISRTTAGSSASEVDNTITKALGVLQEMGVYACALYLKSRKERESARADVVLEEMLKLLSGIGVPGDIPDTEDTADVLAYLTDNVTNDLDRLLLVKETLEQMLTYARYGAKARG